MKRGTIMTAVLVLVAALTLLVGEACSSSPNSPQTGTGGATISPEVSYCPLNREITIQNNDKFDWTQVVLTIDNAFKYDAVGIRAGKSLTVKVSAFKKDNNTAFSGTFSSLTIDCQTPNGKASATALY